MNVGVRIFGSRRDGDRPLEDFSEECPLTGNGPPLEEEVPVSPQLHLLLLPGDFHVLHALEMGPVQGIGYPEYGRKNRSPLLVRLRQANEVGVVLSWNIFPVIAGDIRHNEHLVRR